MMTRTLCTLTTIGRPLAAATLLALGACGGGGDGPQTGQLSIAVTDAPIDTGITLVNVRFTGIELKPENDEPILFDFGADNERDIDLLQLQGEASAYLIVDETVPAGRYPWARLLVEAEKDVHDSYIEKNGAMYPLYIPSGARSGLKLVSGFVVPAGGSADFVIDWNLAQAIHAPTGQDQNHYLRPALRITDRAESGVIRGTVAPELIDENAPADCAGGNRVYLFAKPDAQETPVDDLDMETDDGRAEVLTTASVEYSADRNAWEWVFGFVAPGSYTVAFTCSATADDPALDEYPDATAGGTAPDEPPEIAGSTFGFASRADVDVAAADETAAAL
jgi:hypothetical protein